MSGNGLDKNVIVKTLRDRAQWITYLHLCVPAWRHNEADALFQKWHDDASPYDAQSPQSAVTAALVEMGLKWSRIKNS